jgi:hypothetical protein
MNTRSRIENLENKIPAKFPPCSVVDACRVWGIYLHITGLNPAGYPRGDLAFMFPVDPNQKEDPPYQPFMDEEQKNFYETHLAYAIEYRKGQLRGDWT